MIDSINAGEMTVILLGIEFQVNDLTILKDESETELEPPNRRRKMPEYAGVELQEPEERRSNSCR